MDSEIKIPRTDEDDPRQSMLNACSSGDVATLQQLFLKHGIQPGSKPIPTKSLPPSPNAPHLGGKAIIESGIPSTDELLQRAVAAKQVGMVKFILHTYPSLTLSQSHGVVSAVLDNPSPSVLQALCDHDSNFASFSVDYCFRSFLTDACSRPPALIVPVIHVLLDNGTDVHDGWPAGYALWAAITGNQPVEIVSKILEKGGIVSSGCVVMAIRRGDADVVEALLSSRRVSARVEAEKCVEESKKTGDEEIIAIVQTWARKKVERDAGGSNEGSKTWGWKFWKS